MTTWPLFGIAIGLDNAAVIACLGVAALGRDQRAWLLASFLVCEAVAPALGAWMGSGMLLGLGEGLEWLGLSALFVVAALLLASAWRGQGFGRFVDSRATMLLLAVLLSFDNLAAGVGHAGYGGSAMSAALALGLVSAFVCMVGFVLGRGCHRLVEGWANAASGTCLIGVTLALASGAG